MNSYQTIIEQNNAAVAMLRRHMYDEAIKTFSVTLRSQKEMGFSESRGESVTMSLDQCMLRSSAEQQPSQMETSPYIYTQGISMPTTAIDQTVLAPTIIFNLALSLHLRAGQSSSFDERNTLLRKSLRLYELAYHSQEGSIGENTLFKFASVNNVAVVHKSLNNSDMSEKCFEYMLSELMLLVDCGESDNIKCFDGFLWNISHKICSAAAA